MSNKLRIIIALLVIVVLAWIELQQYSEAVNVPEQTRKIAHILFLVAIMLVGYWGWFAHPLKWLKNAWVLAYTAVLAIIVAFGVIHWKVYQFSIGFLDQISLLRIFFSSPVPFLVLVVFQMRKKGAVEQGL
jgi:hypothetical protein